MSRMQAALLGAREVGFTVLAMSLSLIAVFLPILLMGGIVGRTFREFAMTLSVAILISLVVSLTTTPMMCSQVLRRQRGSQGSVMRLSERGFDAMRVVLRAHAAGRPVLSTHGDDRAGHHRGAQRLPVRKDPQGILSAAGHRDADREPARRSEHFVPGHGSRSCAA